MVAESRSRRSVLSAYLRYAARAQSDGLFGSNTCNIIKPLHNVFCGANLCIVLIDAITYLNLI